MDRLEITGIPFIEADPVRGGEVTTPARRRLAPDERARQFLEQAISYFAEHGFGGTTRELAEHMQITQPLLYRYFPSKDALIERVYQEVFVDRWNPAWEGWLEEAGVPLEARLCRFYRDYSKVILSYEWVRLFMFAGLKGLDFNSRYLSVSTERLFPRVIAQVRLANDLPDLSSLPATDAEIESLWGLHSSIFYLGIRQHIYRMPVPASFDEAIVDKIGAFLYGYRAGLRNALTLGTATDVR